MVTVKASRGAVLGKRKRHSTEGTTRDGQCPRPSEADPSQNAPKEIKGGMDEAIGQLSPASMAAYITSRLQHFNHELSVIEIEDRRMKCLFAMMSHLYLGIY